MKKIIYILSIFAIAVLGSSCSHNDSESKKGHRHSYEEKGEGKHEHARVNKESQAEFRAEMEKKRKDREEREKQAWAKFDQLSDQEKTEWIQITKQKIDKRDSIQAAKRAEMEAKWKTFDDVSLAEQVELLKMRGIVYHEIKHKHGDHGHSHAGESKFPMQEYRHK